MRVILASASPRRRELLSLLLEEFDCCSAAIDETPISDELPEDYVLRMAVEKASAFRNERGVIIGSDTVVVLSGNILQNPASIEDAQGMLSALSGQTHQVMTAVAIMIDAELMTTVSITEVTFATLEMPLIDAYLATDEPWDKAGGYGIQGLAGSFVRRVNGSYSSVVGLPLCETRELLEGAGIRTRMAGTNA